MSGDFCWRPLPRDDSGVLNGTLLLDAGDVGAERIATLPVKAAAAAAAAAGESGRDATA